MEERDPYKAIVHAVKHVLREYHGEPSHSLGGVRSAEELTDWHHEHGQCLPFILQMTSLARSTTTRELISTSVLFIQPRMLRLFPRNRERPPSQISDDLHMIPPGTGSAEVPLGGFSCFVPVYNALFMTWVSFGDRPSLPLKMSDNLAYDKGMDM